MQESPDHEIDTVLTELYALIHPADAQVVRQSFAQHPEVVRDVVRHTAHVMMLAKCVRQSANDEEFHAGCRGLVAMSFVHPAVRPLFRIFVDADRAAPEEDRMRDPVMAQILDERVNRVMSCLG